MILKQMHRMTPKPHRALQIIIAPHVCYWYPRVLILTPLRSKPTTCKYRTFIIRTHLANGCQNNLDYYKVIGTSVPESSQMSPRCFALRPNTFELHPVFVTGCDIDAQNYLNTTGSNLPHNCKYMYVLRFVDEFFLRRCRKCVIAIVFLAFVSWGGGVNQAYSRLSTTHGHITDCNLDSVVYADVCVVI